MTSEEINTAQPPEIILKYAYEYKLKEDILLSLEYNDLEDIL